MKIATIVLGASAALALAVSSGSAQQTKTFSGTTASPTPPGVVSGQAQKQPTPSEIVEQAKRNGQHVSVMSSQGVQSTEPLAPQPAVAAPPNAEAGPLTPERIIAKAKREHTKVEILTPTGRYSYDPAKDDETPAQPNSEKPGDGPKK